MGFTFFHVGIVEIPNTSNKGKISVMSSISFGESSQEIGARPNNRPADPFFDSNAKVSKAMFSIFGGGIDVHRYEEYIEIPAGEVVARKNGGVVKVAFFDCDAQKPDREYHVQNWIFQLAPGGSVQGPAFVRWLESDQASLTTRIVLRWVFVFLCICLTVPGVLYFTFKPVPETLPIIEAIRWIIAGLSVAIGALFFTGITVDILRLAGKLAPRDFDVVPANLRKTMTPADGFRFSPRISGQD